MPLIICTLILMVHYTFSPDILQNKYIFYNLRLPRYIAGIFVGAGLSLCGIILQYVFKNPLAEPSFLGVNNWASFGSVISLYYFPFSATLSIYFLPIGALIGAIFAFLLLILTSSTFKYQSYVLVTGLLSGMLALALTTIALNLAPFNPWVLSEFSRWVMGDLARLGMQQVILMVILISFGILLIFSQVKSVLLIASGDEIAHSLGANLVKIRLISIIATIIISAAVVAFCGIIAFVGLIVPHLVRLFIKEHHFYHIIGSITWGACLVILVDLIIIYLPFHNELQLGAVFILIAFPFFVLLLLNSNRVKV